MSIWKILQNIKELESNKSFDITSNRRMQNRESAVRSRMRKRCYQDELEDRISDLEKLQKDLSEQNAGLFAQNTLLKKQLAYFEDVFANSYLLGQDNGENRINM